MFRYSAKLLAVGLLAAVGTIDGEGPLDGRLGSNHAVAQSLRDCDTYCPEMVIAVGKYPVTRGEFAAFVKDTGRKLGSCDHWDGNSFRIEEGVYWSDAFRQTDQHPVVCVNRDDSQAYVQWLSRKVGKRSLT
jgi:hypothetical protein